MIFFSWFVVLLLLALLALLALLRLVLSSRLDLFHLCCLAMVFAWFGLPFPSLPCLVLSYLVLSCLVLFCSCLALSVVLRLFSFFDLPCLVLSCDSLASSALSVLVLSGDVPSCLAVGIPTQLDSCLALPLAFLASCLVREADIRLTRMHVLVSPTLSTQS